MGMVLVLSVGSTDDKMKFNSRFMQEAHARRHLRGCVDLFNAHECVFYRRRGWCTYGPIKERYCQKTCGFCGIGSQPRCEDKHSYCHYYASGGFCNAAFIAKDCQKSCGACN